MKIANYRVLNAFADGIAGLILAGRKTNCQNLLLITDHPYEDMEEDGFNIAINPGYEMMLQKFVPEP